MCDILIVNIASVKSVNSLTEYTTCKLLINTPVLHEASSCHRGLAEVSIF